MDGGVVGGFVACDIGAVAMAGFQGFEGFESEGVAGAFPSTVGSRVDVASLVDSLPFASPFAWEDVASSQCQVQLLAYVLRAKQVADAGRVGVAAASFVVWSQHPSSGSFSEIVSQLCYSLHLVFA